MSGGDYLIRCRYSRGTRGAVALDHEYCREARAEDPAPVYLERDDVETGQRFVRFGADPDRNYPCPHLLIIEAEVRLRTGDADPYDPAWWVSIHWAVPRLYAPDLRHAA